MSLQGAKMHKNMQKDEENAQKLLVFKPSGVPEPVKYEVSGPGTS